MPAFQSRKKPSEEPRVGHPSSREIPGLDLGPHWCRVPLMLNVTTPCDSQRFDIQRAATRNRIVYRAAHPVLYHLFATAYICFVLSEENGIEIPAM